MNTIPNVANYIYRYAEYIFIFYFFTISFFPHNAEVLKILCFILMICCWFIAYKKNREFIRTSINIPIFLFLLCSLISCLLSNDVEYSLYTYFHDYLPYFLIFFSMVNTLSTQEQILKVIKGMLILFGFVCAYGLFGYYTGTATRDGRLVATFGYHSPIAKYISLLLPIALYLILYFKDYFSRACLAVLACMGSVSLLLTKNRTSWVAILITIILICTTVQKKFLIVIILCSIPLLYFLLPAEYLTHARTIFQINKYSTSQEILGSRILCWQSSVAMIEDYPLFGTGIGSRVFRNTYQEYAEKIVRDNNIKGENIERLSHAHNIFLTILVEMGFIGFIPFLWLFMTIFSSAIQSLKLTKNKKEKDLILSFIFSLSCIFLHGFTDNFWKKPDALYLWFIIGILFVLIRNISVRDREVSNFHLS